MTSDATPTRPADGQLLIDLGPVAVFVIAYNVLQRLPAFKDNAVYIATGIFIATTLAAIAYCQIKRGRVPPVLIVTGVIVTAFGGLTIALHDATFIKLKPTILNAFFGAAIAGSLLIGQNVWRLMFGHLFVLPDRIWTILAWRWAAFFLVLAALNEILRDTLTTEGWVTWHFPVLAVPTFAFALLNTPLILKHQIETPAPDPAAPGA